MLYLECKVLLSKVGRPGGRPQHQGQQGGQRGGAEGLEKLHIPVPVCAHVGVSCVDRSDRMLGLVYVY